MADFEHILPVADHHVLVVLEFPWPAYQHCKQPLSIVAEFGCSAMDAVVESVAVELDAVLAAHKVDTSLVRDVARADWAGSEVDAFPIFVPKKKNRLIYVLRIL